MAVKVTEMDDAKGSLDIASKRKGFPFAPVLVVAIVITAITAVLAFNVFSIRDRYIAPYVRDMPLIGNMIPQPKSGDSADEAVRFKKMTEEEISNHVSELNDRIERLQANLDTSEELVKRQNQTISKLREYEGMITGYREDKAALDAMIARNDYASFAEFYERVAPENAKLLYREAVAQLQRDSDMKSIVATYTNMEEDAAASALEELMQTNAELVVKIMRMMAPVARAEIFNVMKKENVATITRLLEPIPVVYAPIS